MQAFPRMLPGVYQVLLLSPYARCHTISTTLVRNSRFATEHMVQNTDANREKLLH